MRHLEASLQRACVRWFNIQYHQYYGLLYSSLNGVHTTQAQARTAKAEGMIAGVADLTLSVARKGYHGLFIEMKNGKAGAQSELQKLWQQKVEAQGYRYVICRCFEDFKREIETYLNADTTEETVHSSADQERDRL